LQEEWHSEVESRQAVVWEGRMDAELRGTEILDLTRMEAEEEWLLGGGSRRKVISKWLA